MCPHRTAVAEPVLTSTAPFTVLLGPDYSGKSSVLRGLAGRQDLAVVSCDRALTEARHPLVAGVQREFMAEGLGAPPGRYSSDLLVTLLQVAVVHLRDQFLAAPHGMPVIMDSYYFKILAKCVLLGHSNEALFAWWRSFPRPDRVVYLDVPPEVAWRRSGHGASLNPLEHYGERPTRAGFTALQRDLRRLLLAEVAGGGCDLRVVDFASCGDVGAVTRLVERAAVS